MKQNPKPWEILRSNEVEIHRHVACRAYDKCLDYAIAKKWKGWTCFFCATFHKQVVVRQVGKNLVATREIDDEEKI